MNNLYVMSTDECEGSMTVTDRCGQSLSRSKSIFGTTGTVVGPSTLEPGGSGTFYHDLGPSATYDGTLEMVQQSGNGAILRMPAGASGSYTASWSASCGRSATWTVTTSCDNYWRDEGTTTTARIDGLVYTGGSAVYTVVQMDWKDIRPPQYGATCGPTTSATDGKVTVGSDGIVIMRRGPQVMDNFWPGCPGYLYTNYYFPNQTPGQ